MFLSTWCNVLYVEDWLSQYHKPVSLDHYTLLVTIGLSKKIWLFTTSAVAYGLACEFAECLVKDVVVELDDGSQVQELQCSTSSNVSNVQRAMKTAEVVTEISDSTISSSALQDNVLEVESELSTKKHSISIEVRC